MGAKPIGGVKLDIKFDHLVFFIEDLHQAVVDFKQKGFHVVYGGSHPMWGTYNALIYFEDCYIELIAIEQEMIFNDAAKKPFTLHETISLNNRKGGYTRIALRTANATLIAQQLRKADFDVVGPEPFSRNTPTGNTIHWTLIHTGRKQQRTLPFIIDWQKDDLVRLQQLANDGIIAPHPNGVKTIASIKLRLVNLDVLERYYQALQVPITQDSSALTVHFENKKLIYHDSCEIPELQLMGQKRNDSFKYENTLFTFKF